MLRFKLASLCAALIAGVAFSGCAAKGPPYVEIEKVPEGKALITIYRPPQLVGSAVSYMVHDGETKLFSMKNGGFYTYPRDPGEARIWASTEWEEELFVNVEAGKRYYIRAGVTMGAFIGHPSLEIYNGKGRTAPSDVRECKELPGSYHPDTGHKTYDEIKAEKGTNKSK